MLALFLMPDNLEPSYRNSLLPGKQDFYVLVPFPGSQVDAPCWSPLLAPSGYSPGLLQVTWFRFAYC